MKRTTIYFAFLALAMASMFTSCAFLQKGEFAQRKYYNFPRTNHNTEQTTTTRIHKSEASLPVIAKEDVKISEPVASVTAIAKNTITSNPLQKTKTKNHNSPLNVTSKQNTGESTEISFKKSDIRKQALSNESNFPFREDAGLMLFIAVIASIFLPPLGIFIKENWRTTGWFWFTFLLCVLAAGFLGFANAGFPAPVIYVLWLAAVIIALLVVFDVL